VPGQVPVSGTGLPWVSVLALAKAMAPPKAHSLPSE